MHLGLRAKLFSSFGAVLALLVIVGFVGHRNTTEFLGEVVGLLVEGVATLAGRLVLLLDPDSILDG